MKAELHLLNVDLKASGICNASYCHSKLAFVAFENSEPSSFESSFEMRVMVEVH